MSDETNPIGCGCAIVSLAIGTCILIASVGIAWWMVRGTFLYFWG